MSINYLKYPKPIKIMLFFYLIGYAIGMSTHIIDLIKGGFLPYGNAPMWKNIYWTLLTFLDFLVIVLILKSIIPALVISNLIIISDILINTNGLQIDSNTFDDYRIVLQIIFSLYILTTTPIILWKYKVIKE